MRPLLLFLLLLAEPVAVNSNLNPCFKGNPLMGNPCRKAGSNFSKTQCMDNVLLNTRHSHNKHRHRHRHRNPDKHAAST